MKLWLDDLRPAPEGWVWVKTVAEAKKAIKANDVEVASLDHDLGGDPTKDKDANNENGMCLMNWLELLHLEGRPRWPKCIIIHSVNPHASIQMFEVASRYTWAYQKPFGTTVVWGIQPYVRSTET